MYSERARGRLQGSSWRICGLIPGLLAIGLALLFPGNASSFCEVFSLEEGTSTVVCCHDDTAEGMLKIKKHPLLISFPTDHIALDDA